jgi:hypothetical protein
LDLLPDLRQTLYHSGNVRFRNPLLLEKLPETSEKFFVAQQTANEVLRHAEPPDDIWNTKSS